VLTLLQQFSDGLVAILPHDDAPYLKALNEADVPVVVVDQRGVFPQYPSVASDNYEGARLAVQHLVELGHTRIAFISGDERLTAAQDRARGFNDAMRQQGLRPEASLTAIGRFSQAMGFKAASHLLKLKRPPTAIFAANDLSAFGAIAAAHELGMRVPDDVSIIGFDDVPMASQVYPPLTTIRQPLQQMGRSAVNILLARIAGIELPSDRITLPTDLILRNSTARPAEKRVAQR
jgi:LacI family transcriptional regulator